MSLTIISILLIISIIFNLMSVRSERIEEKKLLDLCKINHELKKEISNQRFFVIDKSSGQIIRSISYKPEIGFNGYIFNPLSTGDNRIGTVVRVENEKIFVEVETKEPTK